MSPISYIELNCALIPRIEVSRIPVITVWLSLHMQLPCRMKYQYKVKVFNPIKRKKPITRQLHDFHGKFESIAQMKTQITQELKDALPKDCSVDVGYFEGRQSSKVWLVSVKDLQLMYHKAKAGGEISLWVQPGEEGDSDSDDPEPVKKKRSSKRQEKEDDVEGIYSELKSKHGDDYTVPQLKLWARMIQCGTHDNYDDPPRVPMITGIPPKHPKKDTLAEAITGAAEAVAKVFAPSPQVSSVSTPVPTGSVGVGISPGKSADLRMKNFQQLRYLQQLYEENILSDSELREQKAIILDALRKLA